MERLPRFETGSEQKVTDYMSPFCPPHFVLPISARANPVYQSRLTDYQSLSAKSFYDCGVGEKHIKY
jgi:hypothetical protein